MKPIRYWFPVCVCLLWCGRLRSQDTLHLTMPEAEQLFMQKNLDLLAASAQVGAIQALEIQSRLYPNPTLNAAWNLRDPENDKWLHTGRTGQQYFEIEQLILLGGKRKAELALARANTEVARLNLETLLRSLLYELRKKAAEQYILEMSLERYDAQLAQLGDLVKQVQIQVGKNNLPARDLLRLQATHLRLRQERTEAFGAKQENYSTIRLLLGTPVPVKIIIPAGEEQIPGLPVLDSLIATGLQERPGLRLAVAQRAQANASLVREQKQAIPDLTGFVNYDRQSGAFRNEFNMGVGIPLPLFSRNQGNIRSARLQAGAAQYDLEKERLKVTEEVTLAWQNYMERSKVWEEGRRTTESTFTDVMNAALLNYRKGNISLLEFMDMYEAGMEAFQNRIEMQAAFLQSILQLNYATAQDVLPLNHFFNISTTN